MLFRWWSGANTPPRPSDREGEEVAAITQRGRSGQLCLRTAFDLGLDGLAVYVSRGLT